MTRTWDIGDAEPEGVDLVFDDIGDEYGANSPRWSKTYTPGEWKGYQDGKTYLTWEELVRRFGPVRESPWD
jgi:hypothetical protein